MEQIEKLDCGAADTVGYDIGGSFRTSPKELRRKRPEARADTSTASSRQKSAANDGRSKGRVQQIYTIFHSVMALRERGGSACMVNLKLPRAEGSDPGTMARRRRRTVGST